MPREKWEEMRFDEPTVLPTKLVWPLAMAYIAGKTGGNQTGTLMDAIQWACQQIVMVTRNSSEKVISERVLGTRLTNRGTVQVVQQEVREFTLDEEGNVAILDVERQVER